ncbi:MAG: hypothetical protein JXB48_00695 [Candidatus Latescibacteria bacterium]|nr:hypothetical protein [Candidatus Latescibacterota bacterium]
MKNIVSISIILIMVFGLSATFVNSELPSGTPYGAWKNGPPKDPDYFPIAVWLQDPSDAAAYKKAGINLYVGLWQGPTEEQLAKLREAGMQTICHQNEVGLKNKDENLIIGWMHGDEPDNAQQPVIDGKWSPPVLPEKIQADYGKIKATDPSRPVLLNLGQAVAWNNYIGRGVRRNHPEDYPEYAKGSDIVSFDIYPVVHRNEEIKGNLWYVPRGVERLRTWTNNEKVVWNCIETTRIRAERRATPHELRAEVWMSIIHGSMGLIYFVHEWAPESDTRRLLHDPEMLEAVTAVNNQIHSLAPVINSPTNYFGTEVTSSDPAVPIATMTKRYNGETYVFAVCMRNNAVKVSYLVSALPETATAEVIGEARTIEVVNGAFEDNFVPYDVHLYRIR